jgi:hypothetical protein
MRQLRKPNALLEQQNIGRMRKDFPRRVTRYVIGFIARAAELHSATPAPNRKYSRSLRLSLTGQIIGSSQEGIPELLNARITGLVRAIMSSRREKRALSSLLN